METELPEGDGESYTPIKASRRTEFFWLCDRCAGELTLGYDHKGSVLVKPAYDHRAVS